MKLRGNESVFTLFVIHSVAALYQISMHLLLQFIVLWLKTLIFSIPLHAWNHPSSSFSPMPFATCSYITAHFAANQVLCVDSSIHTETQGRTRPKTTFPFPVSSTLLSRERYSLCGGPCHKRAICLMIHNPLHAEC